jgi:hypothetical protein
MKMSQIKIHKDLPQGELPQREERLRKTLFGIKGKCSKSKCIRIFLKENFHREKKDYEKTF